MVEVEREGRNVSEGSHRRTSGVSGGGCLQVAIEH
jgi:hypothetical protein